MDTHAEPEQNRQDAIACGPPVRRLFRDVIADRLPPDGRPPHAAMLFGAEVDPCWDERTFLGDFCNEILHQDTCRPGAADGLVLLAHLATGDRVPARQRFEAVHLLFKAATVTERGLAEAWPATPKDADPDSEALARNAVRTRTPGLLTRWPAECPAVRLALAGLAVVFPTDRTLAALTPRLQGFVDRHPRGTGIGDYVRFVLVLATQDDDRILAATERFTDTCWTGTARGVPARARALHLLGRMLAEVGANLARHSPQ
ncbi:hypothetical protein [Streptomyces sp. NRRL S-495]|uniref:hypothetical protein n=1 Tax=Streptomyces sp. NRRL S-495 TaxID=1609133 RepID=UPI0005F9A247|nr:hypothetical protein [Streptomyces sp. NRRL S-495]KJY26857.1 hypothetical protein VR45_36080 [Streptomyces sp. NRRL S-495]